MKNHKLKFKISIFLLSTFYFLFSIFFAQAQVANQPQFLATWQSRNYAPSWYAGKVLATQGSQIDISFNLIEKGKIVDLSKNKIRWYVNDDLKINENDGLGIKNHSFIFNNYTNEDIEAHIVIVDYKTGQLDEIITIPLALPEAVIDAPYPNSQISSGSNSFRAYPFFFNIKELADISFEWTVNNRTTEGAIKDSNNLNLGIDSLAPSGFDIKIGLLIKSFLNEIEFASQNVNLKVK